MKILTVIGARPQFVKAAVLSRLIKNYDDITEVIIHTGQHFDENMSDIFFKEMSIPAPKYSLNINSLSHGAMTGKMMIDIENIINIEKPDWVLVYGDTNSTLAGALTAKKLHYKIAHVEAGLRSFDIKMPEEVNRILTDRISDILFCPTTQAENNLEREGFNNFPSRVINVGDIMYDAALYYSQKIGTYSKISEYFFNEEYALVTIHRAENTDDVKKLNEIINGLNQINKSIKVILPIHPRTREILLRNNILTEFTVIDPVGYFDMLKLIIKSQVVLTDSGGLQKEAYFFKKYCITLRDQTEWVELVSNGYNVCCGASAHHIIKAYTDYNEKKKTLKFSDDLYGNGNTGELILNSLRSY